MCRQLLNDDAVLCHYPFLYLTLQSLSHLYSPTEKQQQRERFMATIEPLTLADENVTS